MLRWFLALAAGAALASLQYHAPGAGEPRRLLVPAMLRAGAIALLLALLLDAPLPAPLGSAATPTPLVALDASASWRRGDATRWTLVAARVRTLRSGSLLLFGDSLRTGALPSAPHDAASRAAPAVERARALNRPLLLLTDGLLDDAETLPSLPVGSRIEVVGAERPLPDAALTAFDAPRVAVAGDSLSLLVTVVAGAGGAGPGTLAAAVDDAPLAGTSLGALEPWGERVVTLRGVVRPPARARGAAQEGRHETALLRVALRTAGDVESRNDTLAVALEVAPVAGAVVVSTTPDHDVRFAVEMLRGTLALPVRAFFQVAPRQWREQRRGSLARVSAADVRAAAARAPLLMLHGDTAVFGVPSRLTLAPLVLMTPAPPPPSEPVDAADWFAQPAPVASPLGAPLSGIAWDTLPPLELAAGTGAGAAPGGDGGWTAVTARRARRGDAVPIVTGREDPQGRRAVVVAASGFWRWRFRGGHAADAFAATWGGIFDWLAEARADARAAMPVDGLLRAGDPVSWRRGGGRDKGGGDSLVVLRLVRQGSASAGGDSVMLRWPRGASVATARPLAEGVYEVRGAGGRRLVVVNPSREWLPRRPSVRSGPVGRAPVAAQAGRGLRGAPWRWPYALVLALLCAEWIGRRRIGLR